MGIVKWVVFGLGGFAFLIAVVFSVMLLLSDPVDSAQKEITPKKPKAEISKVKNNDKSNKTNDKNTKTNDKNTKTNDKESELNKELLKTIAGLKDSLLIKDRQIDSLKQFTAKTSEFEQQIKKLTAELKGSKDKKARAKDMAKTLSSMKAKAMAPILNKLDDQTVMLIYEQTSKTSRKDILSALKEDRAARITNKLINEE